MTERWGERWGKRGLLHLLIHSPIAPNAAKAKNYELYPGLCVGDSVPSKWLSI